MNLQFPSGGWNITDTVVLIGGVATSTIVWKILWSRSQSIKSLPLPPGPKGKPILGNILDMPSNQEWFTYTEWGKKYGTKSFYIIYFCITNTLH